MSNRIANILVLGEDQEHHNLVLRYLCKAGHNPRTIRFADLPSACGSQYVREQYPKLVAQCRGMLGRKTGCLLIVMVDADKETVVQREKELCESLDKAGEKAIKPGEPVVILIPKWQVETWIKSALGQTLSEDDSTTDHPRVQSLDIKKAAETIYEWARPNAKVGKSCVESLRVALPRWAATDSPQ